MEVISSDKLRRIIACRRSWAKFELATNFVSILLTVICIALSFHICSQDSNPPIVLKNYPIKLSIYMYLCSAILLTLIFCPSFELIDLRRVIRQPRSRYQILTEIFQNGYQGPDKKWRERTCLECKDCPEGLYWGQLPSLQYAWRTHLPKQINNGLDGLEKTTAQFSELSIYVEARLRQYRIRSWFLTMFFQQLSQFQFYEMYWWPSDTFKFPNV